MIITTEKIFDRVAKNYEQTEENRFKSINIRTLENTKKYLKGSDIILDYGCATGTKALELAGNVKMIYGIDISSKMIEIAKRRAVERNIKNIDFAQTTLFDERLKSESFDVIMVFNILHLLEDNQQVMQRISELLKPGGFFISITTCLGEKKTFLLRLQFLPFILLSKTRLFPSIKRFKFRELEDIIALRNIQILETEKLFHEMSFYFIAAKKNQRT
jgi:2-polyprenyl-3-methyl-5-hydroxy-6-metoxy-1,4-benzoquinol methylase